MEAEARVKSPSPATVAVSPAAAYRIDMRGRDAPFSEHDDEWLAVAKP